ncbi:MAG: DUF1566 domain-containing protein [Alphaproteobacteria bacterium]|nr:DUF1566 domain-containing protein [Alphaproteobacteria bacterium]
MLGAVATPAYTSTACDGTKAGMLQWTGTSFKGCDGASWSGLGGGALGASATNTAPSRNGDITTGLFSDTASTVSIATAGMSRLTITASGSVGIGTTTPNNYSGYTTLSLSNNVLGGILDLMNSGTVQGRLYGDTGSVGLSSANIPIIFLPNGVERMRITSDGNVGIGTTTASNNRLHIVGGSLSINPTGAAEHHAVGGISIINGGLWAARAMQIASAAASTASYIIQAAKDASSNNLWWTYGVNTDNTFHIAPGADAISGAAFMINSSGNVGIGMISPTGKLDIKGGSATNAYTAPSDAADLRILSSNNRSLDGGIIQIGGSYGAIGYIKTEAISGNSGSMTLGTRQSPDAATMQPAMTIDNVGNVGIGITAPNYPLHVGIFSYLSNDNTNEFAIFGAKTASGGYNRMRLHADWIKMGTDHNNPNLTIFDGNTTLSRNGDTALSLQPFGGTYNRESMIKFWSTFDSNPYGDAGVRLAGRIQSGFNNGVWGTEYMAFGVGGAGDGANPPTERMRIDGNGNVGIGTTTPGYKLDVNGASRSSSTVLNSTSYTCDSSHAGTIQWNGSRFQGCDGTNWITFGYDICSDSPSIGTICSDGSVYAGLSPDGNVKMYTTRCDLGMSWNGSACSGGRTGYIWGVRSTITGINSTTAGESNTSGLSALGSNYQAARACAAQNVHGHTDWYLPAKDELNVLYSNKASIGNFDTGGSYYITSTEGGWGGGTEADYANSQRMTDGNQNYTLKDASSYQRCVRK